MRIVKLRDLLDFLVICVIVSFIKDNITELSSIALQGIPADVLDELVWFP